MLIFLYGPDTYRIKEKTEEIIAEYKKKYSSGLNLTKIDMSEKDISDLRAATEVVSMFFEKKLVVLNNIFGTISKEKNYWIISRIKIVDDKGVVMVIKGDAGADKQDKNQKETAVRDFLTKTRNARHSRILIFAIKEVDKRMLGVRSKN